MEELEGFSQDYKKKLDEVGALGEIPDDLALEVTKQMANRSLIYVVMAQRYISYLDNGWF